MLMKTIKSLKNQLIQIQNGTYRKDDIENQEIIERNNIETNKNNCSLLWTFQKTVETTFNFIKIKNKTTSFPKFEEELDVFRDFKKIEQEIINESDQTLILDQIKFSSTEGIIYYRLTSKSSQRYCSFNQNEKYSNFFAS